MDHAGFETYDTMYRAKNIFGAKKVVIVTQKYHLYRALYIAKKLGLVLMDVPCDLRKYSKKMTYLADLESVLPELNHLINALQSLLLNI